MSSQRKLAFLLLATRALNEVYSQEEVMETVKQEQIGTPEQMEVLFDKLSEILEG